eukprot:CAMPEP_0194071370 /NCGR_PEP_ID=MMETSP0009_2-20130614/88673_1 /TAXON_ID=210454 /ORGANISM="Grammatophora oceanica, Strain CCMP 410" /LENGTH=99 /DNA_ID=CAMNT_0038724689 /DNA_START=617 /DNA_END=913 /DNA_ORIENTATION=+
MTRLRSNIIWLSVANAVCHLVSYRQLSKAKGPGSTGVLAFVGINAGLAFATAKDVVWAQWPGITLPAIGGLGLFATKLVKGEGKAIDYTIFAIDVATVW